MVFHHAAVVTLSTSRARASARVADTAANSRLIGLFKLDRQLPLLLSGHFLTSLIVSILYHLLIAMSRSTTVQISPAGE